MYGCLTRQFNLCLQHKTLQTNLHKNHFPMKTRFTSGNMPTYFSVSSREWQLSSTMQQVWRSRPLPSVATSNPTTTCEKHALTGTSSSVSTSPPCVAIGRPSLVDRSVAATSSSRPGDLPCLTVQRLPRSERQHLHCWLHITYQSTQWYNCQLVLTI